MAAVCDPASTDYVPQEDRRAVFDMDGTLVCEKPDYIEVVITKSRLRELATANPALADKPLYKAALADDDAYIHAHVKEAILDAFASETLASLATYWRDYVTQYKHPTLNRKYARLFYKPMTDLIVYLRQAGFSVFVVSTSQQEFIRSFCPDLLPVPKEHVLGSMVGFALANLDEDAPQSFVRQKEYFDPYNADEAKSVRLRERGLGQALVAAGNSMGDYAMLDGVSDGTAHNLVLVIDHDDPVREFEYQKPKLLAAAEKRGWLVVSMKTDFNTVFDQSDATKTEPVSTPDKE
ncbi:MAG: haloacid dehalogenase-like hydrolase [Planctomycetes bacterium]|nr:haloacid dehalogenase-like hydrolase [Planctomycetota bacterium]